MTTIISAPSDLIIANSDGIKIRFAGIEPTFIFPPGIGHGSQNRGITVHFQGVTSSETIDRNHHYLAEIEKWAKQRDLHGTADMELLPRMPAVPVLERVQVEVSDDVGTEYRWAGGKIAGTGSEWEGSWGFIPEPPSNARLLTLAFTLDGEPTGKLCQLQLK